ncbi:MAG: hypothetical protein IKD68_02485 [Solobacterium sp.]|nr:hypothetical protein [Solobacterium sp.]
MKPASEEFNDDNNLQEHCWIIDIFPKRVSEEFNDRFSAVESWFLKEPQRSDIVLKKLHFLLKLNCYMRFQGCTDIGELGFADPGPEHLLELLTRHSLTITAERLRIRSDKDETCMVLFTDDAEVPELIRTLCVTEGWYLWPA